MNNYSINDSNNRIITVIIITVIIIVIVIKMLIIDLGAVTQVRQCRTYGR